ncbi:ROK family protein [Paenibacillus qinlingensis]|uniref:ROK family protein n=1 Tax=Paenibacillus qinlingensis TaxID=1837343 RepID=UPI00286BBD93|nr:ROK family protein [Paenibacillus qinlingensis]
MGKCCYAAMGSNLPRWDHIPIVMLIKERFGVPVDLQNDANACALAEWRWGGNTGYDLPNFRYRHGCWAYFG